MFRIAVLAGTNAKIFGFFGGACRTASDRSRHRSPQASGAAVTRAGGVCLPSRRSRPSGNAHTFIAERRNGCARALGNSSFCTNRAEAWTVALRCASSSIYRCDICPAYNADSALGGVLSLELFSLVRICILLRHNQLFDGRLWSSCSLAVVADLRPGRKCHRVMMCGLSVSLLFAIVSFLVRREDRLSPEVAKPVAEPASTFSQWSTSA
jgi:hypothetical protein